MEATSSLPLSLLVTSHHQPWYSNELHSDPIAKWFHLFDSTLTQSKSATDPIDCTTSSASYVNDLDHLSSNSSFPPLSSLLAIDCEMVVIRVDDDHDNNSTTSATDEPMLSSNSSSSKTKSKTKSISSLPPKPLSTPTLPVHSLPILPTMRIKTALARVSIVDYQGNVLLDTFCKPHGTVLDYKTEFSGVKESDLVNGSYEIHLPPIYYF